MKEDFIRYFELCHQIDVSANRKVDRAWPRSPTSKIVLELFMFDCDLALVQGPKRRLSINFVDNILNFSRSH